MTYRKVLGAASTDTAPLNAGDLRNLRAQFDLTRQLGRLFRLTLMWTPDDLAFVKNMLDAVPIDEMIGTLRDAAALDALPVDGAKIDLARVVRLIAEDSGQEPEVVADTIQRAFGLADVDDIDLGWPTDYLVKFIKENIKFIRFALEEYIIVLGMEPLAWRNDFLAVLVYLVVIIWHFNHPELGRERSSSIRWMKLAQSASGQATSSLAGLEGYRNALSDISDRVAMSPVGRRASVPASAPFYDTFPEDR